MRDEMETEAETRNGIGETTDRTIDEYIATATNSVVDDRAKS